jgi:riboflavin kinase/FMN adenylyltransferase
MRIIRDFDVCPEGAKNTVMALGNFDGVHLGHQAILRHCVDFAHTENRPAAAMTFEPHPREFFAKIKAQREASGFSPIRIYTFRKKARLLKEAGIDYLFVARFNARFAATSSASFIDDVLCAQLQASHVVTGYNFAFGKGRGGDTKALGDAARSRGFGFTAISAVQDAGHTVSSSAIRESLARGDVAAASAMLGRPYRISGRVRRGQQRGRTLGFPTANLSLSGLFKPRFGVYAVRVEFNDGTCCPGVANLGIKPTFSATEPLLEVHFFDMDRVCYGQMIHVELVQFIRDEQKFAQLEALRAQIAEDCKTAKTFLRL